VASEEFVVVLTTLPTDSDANHFASQLVEERLAACVSVLPAMRSVYRWNDAIEKSDEHQLLIKTASHRLPELEARVKALHPYDTPELVVIPITHGSPTYLAWLSASTHK
jgi:periplasmic divalent cation tolerance protein